VSTKRHKPLLEKDHYSELVPQASFSNTSTSGTKSYEYVDRTNSNSPEPILLLFQQSVRAGHISYLGDYSQTCNKRGGKARKKIPNATPDISTLMPVSKMVGVL
jgi:hypothetical protein